MLPFCVTCLFSLSGVSDQIAINYGIDQHKILYKLIYIANYVDAAERIFFFPMTNFFVMIMFFVMEPDGSDGT